MTSTEKLRQAILRARKNVSPEVAEKLLGLITLQS
jgi:hypothetical protein